jgi:hypothetical protein
MIYDGMAEAHLYNEITKSLCGKNIFQNYFHCFSIKSLVKNKNYFININNHVRFPQAMASNLHLPFIKDLSSPADSSPEFLSP